MTRRSRGYVVCSFLGVVACTGAPRARDAAPSSREAVSPERGGGSAVAPGSDERGMRVESAPLTFRITLHLQGSRNGTLRDGDTVVSGDRIQVSIQTSEDAHLYLAYCTADRMLAVHGSIRTRAGEVTIAPGKETHLVLDDTPGPEALYVILSRAELSSADPRLAGAIQASRPGGATEDCGGGLVPRAKTSPAPVASPRPRPGATSGAGREGARTTRPGEAAAPPSNSATGAPVAPPPRGRAVVPDDGPPPLVTIERGMYVSQDGVTAVTASADAHGIAILRYRFQHVAAPRR